MLRDSGGDTVGRAQLGMGSMPSGVCGEVDLVLVDLPGDPRNPACAKTCFAAAAGSAEPGAGPQLLGSERWKDQGAELWKDHGALETHPQGGLLSLLLWLKCEHVKRMVTVALWGPHAAAEPSPQSHPWRTHAGHCPVVPRHGQVAHDALLPSPWPFPDVSHQPGRAMPGDTVHTASHWTGRPVASVEGF